ncbi:UNVERIFIED_CONTAM: hypothetical protein NY603_18630, partial [Bacteroidetes bacterium 56_B9]
MGFESAGHFLNGGFGTFAGEELNEEGAEDVGEGVWAEALGNVVLGGVEDLGGGVGEVLGLEEGEHRGGEVGGVDVDVGVGCGEKFGEDAGSGAGVEDVGGLRVWG